MLRQLSAIATPPGTRWLLFRSACAALPAILQPREPIAFGRAILECGDSSPLWYFLPDGFRRREPPRGQRAAPKRGKRRQVAALQRSLLQPLQIRLRLLPAILQPREPIAFGWAIVECGVSSPLWYFFPDGFRRREPPRGQRAAPKRGKRRQVAALQRSLLQPLQILLRHLPAILQPREPIAFGRCGAEGKGTILHRVSIGVFGDCRRVQPQIVAMIPVGR